MYRFSLVVDEVAPVRLCVRRCIYPEHDNLSFVEVRVLADLFGFTSGLSQIVSPVLLITERNLADTSAVIHLEVPSVAKRFVRHVAKRGRAPEKIII